MSKIQDELQTAKIEVEDDEDYDLSDVSATDIPVLVIFWILAFVVFLQFFTRYVLNNSLGWTEEIARFLLIAVTFTGAVMATRKNSHIAVEFIYRYLPRPVRRVAQLLIDVLSTAFYAGMVYLTLQLAGRTGQLMVSIEVPKSYLYYYVAICFAAMTLYGLWNTVKHLRTGTSRLIDPDDHGDLKGAD
ncbi:TRAP transporter small permease [Pseudoponticoccus marisrubri]|uniref:TRAP transporter small permease protein n=1 Tax=Pseudoponticoccus marisrubri TaxID=1685382 RepID=A0A0W7WL20_9RHOB|nr:TRAP transporter small permease [Pseudoponticoccus marisrubri]KUF11223.1 ABC transporter permease [Pseudoponticoccus marisrubri]